MTRRMFAASGATLVLLCVFWGLFLNTRTQLFYILGTASLTACYHFTTRLVISGLIDYRLKNTVDYGHAFFAERPFERGLYKRLRVRRWKDMFPASDDDLFSLKRHAPEEIIMAGCEAEIAHWACLPAALLSILGAIWFGYLWMFCLTGIAAALYDLLAVCVQRFNRVRLLSLCEARRIRNDEL